MHRTIELSVPAEQSDTLAQELVRIEDVKGLTVLKGGSVKPPGDVVTMHTLTRGMDQVLRLAQAASAQGRVTAVTSEATSISDPEQQGLISRDVDEAAWEEMKTSLRRQGRMAANPLALMALGGGIATAGLVSDPSHQAVAFVAA